MLQADVPNFLRIFLHHYAVIAGNDGRLWEHPHPGSYDECKHADNGSAGWFLKYFRKMLAMEIGQSLWIARATPRAWLEQGKKIAVKNAPTRFGHVAYEMVSDVNSGKITATIEIPGRNSPESVIVRFRHPEAAPIKGVTVNGKPWTRYNRDKEIIELTGLTGKVVVTASY